MKSGRTSRRKVRKSESSTDSSLLEPLVHVWLAGLGAASTARAKGPNWLQNLIKEGARLEARERNAATNAVRRTLGGARALVRRVVDELPPVRVLAEVRALRKQVDAMNAKLDRLARARRSVLKQRRPRTR